MKVCKVVLNKIKNFIFPKPSRVQHKFCTATLLISELERGFQFVKEKKNFNQGTKFNLELNIQQLADKNGSNM